MSGASFEHQFVVMDERFLIALPIWKNARSMTANLYLNLEDYKAGRATERNVLLEFNPQQDSRD